MRLPAPRRRRQLLDVARELFAAKGFHTTSMETVAEAAGVTKPVIYQHFRSKRDLYQELLEDVGDRLLTAVATAAAPACGRERVHNGFAAYFRFVFDNSSAFRLLFGASVRNDPEFSEVAEGVLNRLASMVVPLITFDVSDEHRHVLAHALVGVAEAVGRRALFDDNAEHDPEVLARWTTDMAWYGLRGIILSESETAVGLREY
jgi:AcrR family transcriptional regulator